MPLIMASVAAEVVCRADAGAWEASSTSPSLPSAAEVHEPGLAAVVAEEAGGVGATSTDEDTRAIPPSHVAAADGLEEAGACARRPGSQLSEEMATPQ
jgi:hypothetical protein